MQLMFGPRWSPMSHAGTPHPLEAAVARGRGRGRYINFFPRATSRTSGARLCCVGSLACAAKLLLHGHQPSQAVMLGHQPRQREARCNRTITCAQPRSQAPQGLMSRECPMEAWRQCH